jgi:hypothetical protein
MRKIGYLVLVAGLVVAATATTVLAGTPSSVPEISPTSLSAGLALLAGGVVLVRARRRK